jgi:type IV pilus assembly protein PilF
MSHSRLSIAVVSAVVCGLLLGGCTADMVRPDRTAVQPASTTRAPLPVSRPMSEQVGNDKARRSAKARTDLGMAYMRSGRIGIAMDEARAAVEADPGYAPGHLLLGMSYAIQEQPELARPHFETAAQIAPGDPEVNEAYGWYLCSRGREADGLHRLEAAARNPYNSKPSQSWFNAGLCYMRLQQFTEAEQRFQRALQADGSNLMARLALADASFRLGNFPRAKHWLDQSMQRMSRTPPDVLWLAARVEHQLGNAQAVRVFGNRLLQDYPNSEEALRYREGKFE